MMMDNNLNLLIAKQPLTEGEAEAAMEFVLTAANPHQVAAFLAVLKHRGETVAEILGMMKALVKNGRGVDLPFPVLDIVGTGGDFANTVNISTGAAILAAACGIPIAKHGNRSVSSRSGSADVLEALGIKIEVPPEKLSECLKRVNIAFMFAPYYYPSLKQLSIVRNGLKFPTAINMLGPLINPARATYALIGVAKEQALELVSQAVMKDPSKKKTLIFHGCGLDELTPLGPIIAYEVYEGQRIRHEIDPRSLGFAPCALKDLQGGDAQTNATLLKEVFAGQQNAIADSLIFNAGAAIWIFGKASSLQEGITTARDIQKQGKAAETLAKWKIFSEEEVL